MENNSENKQLKIGVMTSYTYEEKETKALGWFGVLTNAQKSKYAEKYFNKKSLEKRY